MFQLAPSQKPEEYSNDLSLMRSDIGIVEDDDTALHNITLGQYVIWKGSLKKASSAISIGDTLSSSNLSDVSNGLGEEVNSKANKTEAIKNITRDGTTFTATKCDGTTFTFTQQDNNTWRGIQNNLTSTSTTDSLSAAQGKALNDSLNSHGYLGVLGSQSDLNSCVETGFYKFSPSVSNIPASDKYGVMICISTNHNGTNNQWYTQIASTTQNELYVRHQTNLASWTAWRRIYTGDQALPVASGGTGATTAANARTNLGASAKLTRVGITSSTPKATAAKTWQYAGCSFTVPSGYVWLVEIALAWNSGQPKAVGIGTTNNGYPAWSVLFADGDNVGVNGAVTSPAFIIPEGTYYVYEMRTSIPTTNNGCTVRAVKIPL